ncbi:MAG: GIY-YIG nuclease family protein [Candidatus Chisholmbacteria bacterium]|nr:GIY-YIG nuclease family protein [Candidatus Chisholmbacteria bacterium]
MFYVYVLLDRNGNFYTGCCSDLKSRYQQHQKGKVFATKNKLPIKLIYYEACINKYDAFKREKYLKSGPGKKYLRNRLKIFFKKR